MPRRYEPLPIIEMDFVSPENDRPRRKKSQYESPGGVVEHPLSEFYRLAREAEDPPADRDPGRE